MDNENHSPISISTVLKKTWRWLATISVLPTPIFVLVSLAFATGLRADTISGTVKDPSSADPGSPG